jgi:hypothetical protein
MFSSKPIIKLDTNKSYYKQEASNDFPVKNYIVDTYGYAPSYYYSDDTFSEEVFDFLIKNGEMINFSIYGDYKSLTKNKTNFKSGMIWFKYKECYLKLTVKSDDDSGEMFLPNSNFRIEILGDNKSKNNDPTSKKTFNIGLYCSSNIKEIPFEDFEKFIIVDEHETKVHLFIKNQYGEYTFEPIGVNLPENLDLELNYGKDFLEVDKKIKERLMEKPNGLFMFHGIPGTGKTTYIKYLANIIKRDFIYIPTTMIENFTSDPNCLHTLIAKPNSVIILEDAEKAIMKRQGDGMDSSAVSSLLNLSDGILSDILKTSVVLTYNCSKQDIDDALKRKGRLQVEYEFGPLEIDEAKKLAKKLKYPKKFIEEKINKPLTISEIYNLEKEVEFFNKNGKKQKTKRVIGFGSN